MKLAHKVSIGKVTSSANSRGRTRTSTGSRPMVSIASISSLTRIVRSAVKALPDRPAR